MDGSGNINNTVTTVMMVNNTVKTFNNTVKTFNMLKALNNMVKMFNHMVTLKKNHAYSHVRYKQRDSQQG